MREDGRRGRRKEGNWSAASFCWHYPIALSALSAYVISHVIWAGSANLDPHNPPYVPPLSTIAFPPQWLPLALWCVWALAARWPRLRGLWSLVHFPHLPCTMPPRPRLNRGPRSRRTCARHSDLVREFCSFYGNWSGTNGTFAIQRRVRSVPRSSTRPINTRTRRTACTTTDSISCPVCRNTSSNSRCGRTNSPCTPRLRVLSP